MALIDLDGMIEKFAEKTKAALDELNVKATNLDPGRVKTNFISDYRSLLDDFKKEPKLVKEILEELKKFLFPEQGNTFSARLEALYQLFYDQTQPRFLIDKNRRMIQNFIDDFLTSSKGMIIQPETREYVSKLIRIMKGANLNPSSRDIASLSAGSRRMTPEQAIRKIQPLLSLLHLEQSLPVELVDPEDGDSKQIVYYTFKKDVLDFLDKHKITVIDSNGTYHILDNELFEENLFLLIIYAELIGNVRNFETFQVYGFVSYMAILFIIITLPEIQDVILANPVKKEMFDSLYGTNLKLIGIIPNSWEDEQFFKKMIDPLVKLIAFYVGDRFWYDKVSKTDISDNLNENIKKTLSNINFKDRGHRIFVKIPIIVSVKAAIMRIRAQIPP